jgi:N-formylglutamate deformylase
VKSFEERDPVGAETCVIVEVPHAGIFVPAECLAELCAPARAIARDADLYVDEIYAGAPSAGASLLAARLSRYVVDLNRGEEDIDAESVEGGPASSRAPRGIIWRLSSDRDRVLTGPLPRKSFEHRVRSFYRPYHERLQALIADKRARFGRAIVLAAHSMPSVGRRGHTDLDAVRADVVPGTRGRTSAAGPIIDLVDQFFRTRGFEVRHDLPYSGGFTTQHYGRPADGVHVIQIELARRLYMDEFTLLPSPERMEKLRALCTDLVGAVGRAP